MIHSNNTNSDMQHTDSEGLKEMDGFRELEGAKETDGFNETDGAAYDERENVS